ncbi:hypothetical protein V8E51_012599 [Hyaloscypha variabilis]
MFLDLKSCLILTEQVKYPSIYLSLPDTTYLSSSTSCDRFRLVVQHAGLELLRPCTSNSRAMLYHHYIEDCFDEAADFSCRADVKKPLTVSYTSSSLAAGIFERYDGMLESSRQASRSGSWC